MGGGGARWHYHITTTTTPSSQPSGGRGTPTAIEHHHPGGIIIVIIGLTMGWQWSSHLNQAIITVIKYHIKADYIAHGEEAGITSTAHESPL